MAFKDDNEMIESTNYQDINNDLGVDTVNKVQGIDTVNKVNSEQPKSYTYKTRTYASAQAEDDAKNKAQLDLSLGVEHVLDDQETEEYVSTKELYEKNLGVTEYDELRTKLHLKDDESFTDYYNRTHYIPEGFEIQAKLLLAEEKRKKLYAEVEAGNMSEEDFLYEAYGKDLLKKDGVDFSSPLYWYQRYKNKKYDDPRDNATFMLQLIEEARTLFQQEKWYEEKSQSNLSNTLVGYVTGEELSTETIAEIFSEQFEELSKYYDDQAQIVKYYRAGLLQGFNPTIDTDGDGKIDYYLATDGKLYNVNETGEGANTYRAYYNEDGSLNRIVASDSLAGEMTGGFFKSLGRFFTDVIDLGALLVGTVVDVVDGDGFGDTVANYQATMGQFWNSTILGDKDYVVDTGFKTSDGKVNWANIGRQGASFLGTIAAFAATMGIGAAVGGASAAATGGAKATTKLATSATKQLGKEVTKRTVSQAITKGAKAAGKFAVNTAVKLTSWSNGAFASTSFWARTGSIATLALKDTLQSVASLSVNQERLGLSDSEVVGKSITGGLVNFGVGMLLRSNVDEGAINHWAKQLYKRRASQLAAGETMEKFANTLSSKITTGLLTGKQKLAIGFANTAMDSIENVISAWTQTSLNTSGEVFNGEAFGSLINNPQFVFNSLFQIKNTLSDEFKLDKRKLVGTIADAAKMDTDFNKYIDAHIQTAKEAGDISALRAIKQDYDQTIKNNIDSGLSKAEAIMSALETVSTKLDMDADSELIVKWRNDIKNNIKFEYFAQNQAVFNRLKQIQQGYDNLAADSFKGKVYRAIFNKEFGLLNEGFGKLCQRYIAFDIDDRIRQDAIGLNRHYNDIFGKEIEHITLEELDQFKVKSMMGEVTEVQQEDGTIKYMVGNKLIENFTPEEMEAYRNFYHSTDDIHNRSNDIIIDLTNYEANSINGKINESAKQLMAAAYNQYIHEYNLFNREAEQSLPTFVKLSDNKYIVRYHGEGNTALMLTDIMGVVKAIGNIKVQAATAESSADLISSIELLFKVFDTSSNTETAYVLKDNKASIPQLIDTLIKNKILTYTQAAKVYSAIKSHLGTDPMPTGMLDKQVVHADYVKAAELVPFLESLADVRKAQKKIDAGQGTEQDTVAIRSFASKYLTFDPDKWTQTASDTLKIADAEYLISKPEMKNIQKLGFLSGLPESLARTVGSKNFVQSLKLRSNDTEYENISNLVLNELVGLVSDSVEDTKVGTIGDFLKTVPQEDRKPYYKVLGDTNAEADTITQDQINKIIDIINPKKQRGKKKQDISNKVKAYVEEAPRKIIEAYIGTNDSDQIDKYLKQYVDDIKSKLDPEGLDIEGTTEALTKNLSSIRQWAKEKFKTVKMSSTSKALRTAMTTLDNITKTSKAKICEGNNKIVINFKYLMGAEEQRLAETLKRDTIRTSLANAEPNDVQNILFTSTDHYYKYQQELAARQKYETLYGSDNLIREFSLSNPADKEALAQILKDFNYNLNGDILYKDGKTIIPGIYFNPAMFEGIELKSTKKQKVLAQLEEKRTNKYNTNITNKDMVNEPFAAIESWASSIPYIAEDTVLNADNIVMNFLDTDFILSDGYSAIFSDVEAKLGKNAGALVKGIITNYAATIASSSPNIENKKRLFVHYLIDALGDMHEELDKGKLNLIPTNYTITDKDTVKVLKALYEVEPVHGKKNVYTITIKDQKKDTFVKKAYELINSGKIKDINALVPNFNRTNKERHNTLLRGNLNQTQTILGSSIISYVDGKLQSLFDQKFVTDCLIPTEDSHVIDFSITKNLGKENFDKAIADMRGKTVAEILTLDKSNPYIDMQQTAIKAGLALSNKLVESIDKITINDKPLTREQSIKVLSSLGNSDARRYIGMAIRTNADKLKFDKEGRLIVTKELSDSIATTLAKMPKPKSDPKAEDTRLNPFVSKKEEAGYVTGQQLTGLNPSQSEADYSSETIQAILNIAGLTRREVVNKIDIEEDLVDEFIGILKASNKTESEILPVKYLYSFTPTEFAKLKKELTGIIDSSTLKDIESTIKLIWENSELINKYDKDILKDRIPHAEKLGPSINSAGVALITNGDVTNSYLYKQLIDNMGKKTRQKYAIKLSSIDDAQYRNNFYMQELAKKLFDSVVPAVKNKGSIIMQNLNIADNLATLQKSLTNLSYMLSENIEGLESKDAVNLALSIYLSSTGMEYQAIYPEYVFFDKKSKKVVNFAMTGSYSDEEDNLMATIYRDHFTKNEATGKYELDTNDLIVIKTDRNAFNSLYSEAIGDITVIDLAKNKSKIEEIYSQRIEYIKQKAYNKQTTTLKALSNEEVHKLICEDMFNTLERGSSNFAYTINQKGKGLFIGNTLNNIINDREGLSFTKNSRSDIEELIYNEVSAATTFENKQTINSKVQKINDAMAYGVDHEEFMKQEYIVRTLRENTKEVNREIKTHFKQEDQRKVINALEEMTDAINTGDEPRMRTYIETLKGLYGKDNTNMIPDIMSYYIANTDSMDMYMLRLFDTDLGTALNQIDKESMKINVSGTKYSVKELKRFPKLVVDIEVFYGKKGSPDHIYQISLTYEDANGNIHSSTFYNKTKDIQTLDSIKEFEEFNNKYMSFEGTQQAVKEYLESNGTIPQQFLDILKQANNEGAILIGYNSEKFDLPKLTSLNNPVFELEDFKALMSKHIDAYEFAKKIPTTANVIKHGGALQLGRLAQQLDSNIKIDLTHNAEADTAITLNVINKLLDRTITSNEYKYNGVLDVAQLYKELTGKDLLDTTKPYQTDLVQMAEANNLISDTLRNIKIEDENSKAFIESLRVLRQDSDRLTKTYDIINEINDKRVKDYFDILEREWRNEFISTKSEEKRAFAQMYSHQKSNDFLHNVISFMLKDADDDKGREYRLAEIPKLLKVNSLDDIAKALTQPEDVILHALNIDKEAFNEFVIDTDRYNAKEFLETNFYRNVDKTTGEIKGDRDLLQEHSIRTAANSIVYATSDMYKRIQELPVDDQMKKFLSQELFTYYDANADKDYKAKLEPHKFIDMISKLDKEVFNYFLTDPITNQSYESIYRLAQTVSTETVRVDGKDIHLDNDMIAVDYQNFCDLFGLDPNTGVSIKDVKASMGIAEDQDIMIPVIRHPLDKRDSFHFFRLKVLDTNSNEGIRCAINIDSILTKMNGDLDGDHLSILRPNKYLQSYATAINKYKNLPMSLLDKALGNIKALNTKAYDVEKETTKVRIQQNPSIISMLTNDLSELNNYGKTNSSKTINAFYNKKREDFIDRVVKFYGEDYRDFAKDIYIQPPIDVSTKVSNSHRFAFYTDCMGMLSNKENQMGKRLYQIAQVSDYGTLRYTDTVTGMRQKEYLTEDLKLVDIHWVDNIIRLSSTTKTLIENNLQTVKDFLINELNNPSSELFKDSPLPKNVIAQTIKLINTNYTTNPSFGIQQALVYLQTKTQELNQPRINKAVLNLQKQTKDTDFGKFFNTFLAQDKADSLYSYQDIFRIKGNTEGKIFSGSSNSDITDLLRAVAEKATHSSVVSLSEAETEPSHYDIYDYKYVLYKNPEGMEIKEDTFLTLPAIKENSAVSFNEVYLSEEDINYFRSKYSDNDEIKSKDLRKLGLDPNLSVTVRFLKAGDNSIAISRSVDLGEQKLGTVGIGGVKGTPSGHISKLEDVPEVFRDCIIQRPYKFDQKKITSDIKKLFKDHKLIEKIHFFDKNNIELKSKDGKIPAGTVAIKALEPINIMEASGLWASKPKTTKLDIAAYGNNLDATGGPILVGGMLYKADKTGKLIDLDNTRYSKVMKDIEDLDMPDRYEHNGMPLYQLLALSTILKNADIAKLQKTQGEFNSIPDLVNRLVKANGFGSRMLNKIKELSSYVITDNIPDFDKAILSQALFDSVYSRRLASTPNYTDKGFDSKNKAYSQQMRTATFDTISSITGDMAQMSDGTIGEDAYISMVDLQNKILELSQPDRKVSKSATRTLEANDLLNKGLATKRTQVFPYPHNQELSKDYSVVKEFNTDNIKRGEQAGNAQATHSNIVGQNPTDSLDFDYTNLYRRSNEILNRQGSAFLNTYAKNGELTYGDYANKIGPLRMAVLMQSLSKINTEVPYHREFSILQNLDPRNSMMELSMSVPGLKLDERGRTYSKANRTYKGVVDSLQGYNILKKERTSPYYFDRKETFETQNKGKLSDLISNPKLPKDLDQYTVDTGIKESIDLYKGKVPETQEYAQKQKDYIESMRTFREFSTGDDVKEWAERKFYSGSVEGEHKQFKTSKFNLNQGIVLNDSLDLKADRVIKNFNTEAMSIAQDLSTDYVNLAKEVQESNNFDTFNKFAYVLGMWNRKAEANKLYTKTKDSNYKVIIEEIDTSIKNLGIEDADAFLKDFELKNPKQAGTLYTLVQKVQVQAEKYSALCNEPGQNIFFALSPSVKNTKSDKRAASKYMTSMLLHHTDVSEGKITYDGYNILSSMNDTIAQISRQAAIYNNAERLKSYGLMENTSPQDILFSVFNSEEVQQAFLENAKPLYGPKQREVNLALETYLNIMLSSENLIDTNLKAELEQIKDRAFPKKGVDPIKESEAYLNIFNSLNKSIHTTGLSLEQALAEVNTKPSTMVSPEAKMVVTIYNSMADVFAQLSYFTDDTLTTRIAEKLRASVGDTKSLVDQYGRPVDKDLIYKLGDSSFEYVHDSLEKFTHEDKWLVTKALKGELYTIDKNLATALADNVFVKESAAGFKKALQKSSSWCVKMLMSNPFKIIDRFAKFTAFDTMALSTANYKTLLKSGEAMADLRAFFASNGTVKTDNLSEFIYATGLNLSADNFDLIMNNFDAEDAKFNPVKKYTDATGKIFTLQSMFQRYAYWLATKEDLSVKTKDGKTKGPDYSTLGSAYYLKNAIKDMEGLEAEELDYDSEGNAIKVKKQRVSKEGAQAAFAMAQILGSPGDFPALSSKLGKYGAVFTTFPLAAMRWGIGEIRSLGTALKNLFVEGSRLEGAKWFANNGGGILTTYLVENLMISLIADMFGVDDEQEEEWKEDQALPNITQTILTGSPIMDTFSSANIAHEVAELTVKPFIPKDKDDTILSGLERFFYKNIVSHANPIAKNALEIVTNKDLIDDQIIDTKDKYSMWENVFRKMSGYIIGASGANALTNELFNNNTEGASTLISGLKAAVSAEVGNTKVYKSNLKNYYKALNLINTYIYKDADTAVYNYSTGNSFNTSNYNALKSDIYSAINKESKVSDVYSLVTNYLKQGYSLYEIRSAMKNCSIQNKLESIDNLGEFISSISSNDLQNIKTALAFEQHIYPWLDEGEDYVNDLIKDQQSYSSNYLDLHNYKPSAYNTNYIKPHYSNYFIQSNNTYKDYNKDPVNKYFNTLWTTIYGKQEDN